MNLNVKNSVGEQFTIAVIRYFKFNGLNYLIFTKNEVDEAGYQKLYISKVSNMVGNNIDDDIEWNLVRDTIKVIAKANKENTTLPVQDLDESEINGIQIIGQKPFKLTVSSVALLSANKKVEPPVVSSPAIPVVDTFDVSQQSTTIRPLESITVQPAPELVVPTAVEQQPVQSENIPQSVVDATPVFSVPNSVLTETLSSPSMDSGAPLAEQNNSVTTVNQYQPLNNVIEPMDSNVNPTGTTLTNDLFNFTVPAEVVTPVETVDYKKLYEEQTLKLNTLTTELENYKSIVEQLKNILK